MKLSVFTKAVLTSAPLVLLAASGCKPREYNTNSDTSSRRDEVALAKMLMEQAADCFTLDAEKCINNPPIETPDKTFICMAAYLKMTPKIEFTQAAATVNNIDAYREDGKNMVGGQQVIGSGSEAGLRVLLKKHFTYKLCADGKRYSYSAKALQNGYAKSNKDGSIASIVATASMSEKAKTNKANVDAGAANDSYAAKAKFALDNLICIRNLADEPCQNAYPTYVPVTKLNLVGVAAIKNVIGAIPVPNADVTMLPGLDPSQISELGALGIKNENYDERIALISNAKQSILMSSWQIKQKDGDSAGPKLKGAIIAAARNGAKPLIIGDLSTSYGNPYFSQDGQAPGEIPGAYIWGAGVNKSYTYHRKLTVIDGQTVIFGGKNYAAEYMQQYHGAKDWRDTDVKIVNANAAKLASIMFANDWNNNTPAQYHLPTGPFSASCSPTAGASCFKFVTHDPARQAGTNDADSVFAAMVQSINSAKTSVDIENAYVIASYPLVYALRMAADRGVQVRILTNSDKSIDVPELGHVMNLNALAIKQNVKNVKVYLKQAGGTSTLHSKFMIVDGKTAFIGTYNLHPASRTTASEFMGVFDQVAGDATGPVTKLAQIFESDVKHLGRLLDDRYQSELKASYDAESTDKKGIVNGILALGYDTL